MEGSAVITDALPELLVRALVIGLGAGVGWTVGVRLTSWALDRRRRA